MKILSDTNSVFDFILRGTTFYKLALKILGLVRKDDVEEYVSESVITDIYYLVYRPVRDKGNVKN